MLELKDILLPFLLMVVYTVVYLANHKIKNKRVTAGHFIIKLVFVGYIGVLISFLLLYNTMIVFVDNPDSPLPKIEYYGNNYIRMLNIVPFKTINEQLHSGTRGYLNIIFNLLVFVPFPILIKIINPKISYLLCISITLIVTISIEAIQYFIGRSSDIDDIILNLIGALAGILIYKFIIPNKVKTAFLKE